MVTNWAELTKWNQRATYLLGQTPDLSKGIYPVVRGRECIAWDSIAAHSTGLNVLKGIFNTGRYSTITDQITIPYRNGILHGMDLGYDNKIVAAKVWAALFAAREWAMKAEQGLLEAQPDVPPTSWKDLFSSIAELGKVKQFHKNWLSYERILEIDNIVSDSNIFTDGTPEHVLAQFLLFWKKGNYYSGN